MFIDQVKIEVRGGKGGDGCISFHREKFVPRGGPDGGDGGKGGDVIFYVDPGETVLLKLHSRPKYEAGKGENGSANNKTGAGGKDIRLPVPPGTIVRDLHTGEILCELLEEGEEAVVAAGGRGGRGNARFATPTHQTPRRAEPGEPGEWRHLQVELRIVADIGLVGFPNAGKSTLLNALTHARARVGEYPFTTLHPVIGTIPLEPEEEAELVQISRAARRTSPRIIVADIPGILEGAHEGVGLGLDFLKHIERTQVLLFVLDVSSRREHDPCEAYRALTEELGSYDDRLLERPRLVVFTKMDDVPESGETDRIEAKLREFLSQEVPPPRPGSIHRVSAVQGDGMETLRKTLVSLIIQTRLVASKIQETEQEPCKDFRNQT